MSENKFTSRQFVMSLLGFFVFMAFAWSTVGIVAEKVTLTCLYLGAVDVLFFCFNDLAKKLIEKMDMFKGMFAREDPDTTGE